MRLAHRWVSTLSGTYTVLIYGYSTGHASAGDYELYFTHFPGANEGGALTAGVVVEGTIDLGDLDSFTFGATVGDVVSVTLTDTLQTAFVPAFSIYGPTGATVRGITYGANEASYSFTVPTQGVYSVVVHDYSTGYASSAEYPLLLTVN